MPQIPCRKELEVILRALLLTKKEALTDGIPVAQLDNEYRNHEGTRIPFRELGFGCLLDLLQALTGGLIIRYRHGMHHAFPVVDDKIKHVSDMVAGQKDSRKYIRGGRRLTRSPSPWYPRVIQPPVRLDYRLLADVVALVKESPGGINFDYVHAFACRRMNYNIRTTDLAQQLSEISHEVILDRNVIYPVTKHPRDMQHRHEKFRNENTATTQARTVDESHIELRPSGYSESSDENFPSTLTNEARNNYPNNHETNDSCRVTSRTNNEIHEKSVEKDGRPDKTMRIPDFIEESYERDCNENYATEETIANLITDKTKIRLEMLIRKYPDGIWCAELPELYRKEYTIPLNYEEIGFGSVSDFASHLPEIFHCIQLQEKGDFKLFNAKAEKPDVKQTKRTVLTTAALHNIYKYESDAIPAVLSKETAARLIPDGVVTSGETVGQICVTELDRGVHEYIDVIVVDVFTPTFFWIHLLQRVKIFRRFMDDLHEFYERNSSKYVLPIAVMEKGLNCACMYDGKWHRAIIKTVKPDNSVTVMFYDYGTIGSYSAERIYFLHRSFSNLPAQAIPCGLYNVKPVGGTKWTRTITTEFLQKVSSIPLVATIAHIDTDNNSMMIGLTNTAGDEDFHINDWMVQAGYATYGKMVCIGRRNFPFRHFLQCNSPSSFSKGKDDSSSSNLKNVDKLTHDKVLKIKSRESLSNNLHNGSYNILLNLPLKSSKNLNSQKLPITENISNAEKTQAGSHFIGKSESMADKNKGDDKIATKVFATDDPTMKHDDDGTAGPRVNKSRRKFLRELYEAYRRNQTLSSNSDDNLDERRDRTYNVVPSVSTGSSSENLRKNKMSKEEEEYSVEQIQNVPLHLTSPKTDKIIDEFGTLCGRYGHGRMEPINWSSIHETMQTEEKTNIITTELKRESMMKKQPDNAESANLPETTKALWDIIDDDKETFGYAIAEDKNTSRKLKVVQQTQESVREIVQVSIEDSPMLPQSSSSPKLPKAKRALWNLVKSQREKKISLVDKIGSRDNNETRPEDPKEEKTNSEKMIESSTNVTRSLTISGAREKKSNNKAKGILEFGKFHSTLGGNGRMEPITWSELRDKINNPVKTYEVATQTISPIEQSRKSRIPSDLPKPEKVFLKIIEDSAHVVTKNRDSICGPEGNIKMGREVTPLLRTLTNRLGKERNERVRVFIPNEILELTKDNGEGDDLTSSDYSSGTNEAVEKNCTKSIIHETKISSESLLEISESSNSQTECSKPNDRIDGSESIESTDKDIRQGMQLYDHSKNSMQEVLKISTKNEPLITEINRSPRPIIEEMSLKEKELNPSPKNTTSPVAKITNAWLESVYLQPTSNQLSKFIDPGLNLTNDSDLDSDDFSFAEEVKHGSEKNRVDDKNSPSPTKSSQNEVSRKAEDQRAQESQKIHDSPRLQEKKDIEDSSVNDLEIATNINEEREISSNQDDSDSMNNEELANLSEFSNSGSAQLSVPTREKNAVELARNISKIQALINEFSLKTEDDDDDKWDCLPQWLGTSTAEIIENVNKMAALVSTEYPSSMNRSRLETVPSGDESSLEISDSCETSTSVSGLSREDTDTDTQPTDNKYHFIDNVSSETNYSQRPSTGSSPLIKHDVTTDYSEPRESPCPNDFSIDDKERNDSDEHSHFHEETSNCKTDEALLDKPTTTILTEKHYPILSEIKKSKILNISNDPFVHFDDSSSGEKTDKSYKSSFIERIKIQRLKKKLPVVLTNAKEATNQRSVIDAQLEDRNVSYVHSHNIPDRYNNVETVDMNDKSVDIIGPSLNTILEENEYPMTNSILANGIETKEGFIAMLNRHLIMAAKLATVEISKCVSFGISYDSCEAEAREELEHLYHSLSNIGLVGQPTVKPSANPQTPTIPPLPKPTSPSNESLAVESTTKLINDSNHAITSTSELSCPNFDVSPSIISKHDENMNISEKPATIDHSTLASNDISHVKATIELAPDTIQSYHDNCSIVSSKSYGEDQSRPSVISRAKFEKSLFHSAKNFFERMNSTLSQKISVATSTGKLLETNPFKNDIDRLVDSSCTVPEFLPRNTLRRPHGSPQSPNKNLPVESETRVIYDAAPIMYDNVKMNDLRSRLDGEVLTLLTERDDLSETKRVNVESWIQNGYRTSENYVGTPEFSRHPNSAPPIPPRNVSSSVSNDMCGENLCNGSKSVGDNFPDPTGCLTSSEWLEKIDSATNFRREHDSLQRFDDSQLPSNGGIHDGQNDARAYSRDEDSDKRENLSKCEYTAEQEIKVKPRDISKKKVYFRAVQLTNSVVHLIIYDNEGWITVEEFGELIGKTPDGITKIFGILKVDIPFRIISRTDNSRLFEKLDRTSLRVQRDHHNNIDDSLNLVPLKLAFKILRVLKLVSREELAKAVTRRKFPTNPPILQDICTLITAFSEINE